jgi:hypothetical protein
MSAPQMRSPAPALASGKDRAEVIRNDVSLTTFHPGSEGDFAGIYLVRRFGLALPIARTIAALASLGRAFA